MLSHPYFKVFTIVLGYSRKKKTGEGGWGLWNFQMYQRNSMWNFQGLIKKSGISKGDQEKIAEKMALLHFRTPLGLGLGLR